METTMTMPMFLEIMTIFYIVGVVVSFLLGVWIIHLSSIPSDLEEQKSEKRKGLFAVMTCLVWPLVLIGFSIKMIRLAWKDTR